MITCASHLCAENECLFMFLGLLATKKTATSLLLDFAEHPPPSSNPGGVTPSLIFSSSPFTWSYVSLSFSKSSQYTASWNVYCCSITRRYEWCTWASVTRPHEFHQDVAQVVISMPGSYQTDWLAYVRDKSVDRWRWSSAIWNWFLLRGIKLWNSFGEIEFLILIVISVFWLKSGRS